MSSLSPRLLSTLVLLGALVNLSGCSESSTEVVEIGTISLALRAVDDNDVYRLRNATFTLDGPTQTTLNTESDPDSPALTSALISGDYVVTLEDGWRLEKEFGSSFEQVDAQLLSENPQFIRITNNSITRSNFRFQSDGEVIDLEPRINAAALLGFEDVALWTSPASTLSSTDERVQGLHSLSVEGGGYHELESVALPFFEIVNREVKLAIRLPIDQPNPYWMGSLQLELNSSSAGLDGEVIGQLPLTGLTTGDFIDVEFTLPETVFDILHDGFEDLSIRIIVNLPFDARDSVLLDNLRIGGQSACNATCEGSCVEGVCILACNDGWGDCDSNQENGCESSFADTSTCGSCDNSCGPGAACEDTRCVGTLLCEVPQADCDGETENGCEVDLNSDSMNCGACANECAGDEACSEGSCQAASLSANFNISPDWGSGYCGQIELTNGGSQPISDWILVIDLQGAALSSGWNATFETIAEGVLITPSPWSAQIDPGATESSIGFCISRPSNNGTHPLLISIKP